MWTTLFGRFVGGLKARDLYEDSCIIFTGDHGEEFMEEGKLFHASHLSRMQTSPPLYYRPGAGFIGKDTPDIPISSHVDIFPTLLDLLLREQHHKHPVTTLFDGESIFKKDRFPFVVVGRQNWGRNPVEFFLHNGKEKVTFKRRNVSTTKGERTLLRVVSVKDEYDKVIPIASEEVETYVRTRYGKALSRLFTSRENS